MQSLNAIPPEVRDALVVIRGGPTRVYVAWLKAQREREVKALLASASPQGFQTGRLHVLDQVIEHLEEPST